MAKPNSQPVAHRRSARLSNCLAKTPTTKRDLDPEFTDPSSVESSGPKAGPSNHKRKRAADDDAPTAASKPSRKARRGHSL
jgi:hypothetical protein